jgi:hypothetical protein
MPISIAIIIGLNAASHGVVRVKAMAPAAIATVSSSPRHSGGAAPPRPCGALQARAAVRWERCGCGASTGGKVMDMTAILAGPATIGISVSSIQQIISLQSIDLIDDCRHAVRLRGPDGL